LCHAIADALDARFNPVRVAGEISGFVRAASGHCYFSLKDSSGQLRCAMFKRAASGLSFVPREGQRVEVSGRLGVYEPRGELQLVVEAMAEAGEGNLYEQFVLLKARLQAEGLFEPERKKALPMRVRGIGVVTSLGAAALHDVVSALQRRVPHIPVLLAPASVQGANAAAELIQALQSLYALTAPLHEVHSNAGPSAGAGSGAAPIDVILLVRGGGAMEDLWSFNDEALARVLAQSPVPVITGIGHETDFTIADFVADLRAPTPTAAAELCAIPLEQLLDAAGHLQLRLQSAVMRKLDRESQRLDQVASRAGRPAALVSRLQLRLAAVGQRMAYAPGQHLQAQQTRLLAGQATLRNAAHQSAQRERSRLAQLGVRLGALDPQLVLGRGYAWLQDDAGRPLMGAAHMQTGQQVQARMSDGTAQMQVQSVQPVQPVQPGPQR
jgi:exodeoxyribonuclease VII large subunit